MSEASAMGPVLIGTMTETFTPTQSGALSTVMQAWATCAREQGRPATVVALDADADPWPGLDLRPVERVPAPVGSASLKLARLQRKMRGWTHLRQGTWMRRVGDVLTAFEMRGRPWVMLNGPELCVYLRKRFPDACLIHRFDNQLVCKPRARRRYPGCVQGTCAVSAFTARWVEAEYALPPGSVAVVPNGVDAEHFRPAPPDMPRSPRPVLQFVGRTGLEKAPDLLLSAALRLVQDHGLSPDSFSVRLVGSNHWDGFTLDDYQRRLNAQIAELREAGVEVEQTGHVGRDALPTLMATADIHVVPSRWDEPFGLTTLEGMACGLATVASDTGGTPEVVDNAGVLFARDDATSLAAALMPLVRDAAARCRAAELCRARALRQSWAGSYAELGRAFVGGGVACSCEPQGDPCMVNTS